METVPTDFNKRIYQGVRVKHTVKDLLAEKRSRQTTGSRLNSSTNVSQTPFVQMSSSPVLSGYYGVRRSFLPESEIHTTKHYPNDLYSSSLGPKPCDPASIQSYPPLLDPYFIDDYRGTSITSANGSHFSASSLPPLLPHFSGDPSHYLLRDSWEQTVPDTINQLDVLCSDTSQTVSSSTSCLSPESGSSHYRSSSRGSASQASQAYSLHALDDVHYSASFPATSSYAFSPFMAVTNELNPKMAHHLSPDESSETNSLQDNATWPKDDSNTVWGPYELRRNY
ncbi:POU domain class 2-associating factor 2 [Spea bombifrons]|uniref:POU domain class 2-associating factor 2 n=1 Tax=Spea bombifrons TaxID=233779 RepID=UPI00234B0EA0|nr:POU domain class 2-associating factor 2 [Spea bombifrons]